MPLRPDEAFGSLERQLYRHEQELMQSATRSSRKKLEALLAEDFVEFGSTGIAYDRESVISGLLLEEPFAWSIASFNARMLAEGVALVTYIATKSGGESSLRCSIWKQDGARWRMTFHQGTNVQG